jgi:7,8-dihydro-6-hydroxymethylpterin-pyrophosphokinase
LGACLGIEAAMGRKRQFRFASRIIDIDLLIFGNVILNDDDLILPHPRIKKRAFVLAPLSELCSNFEFGNVNFADEYKNLDFSGVKLIKKIQIT